MIMINDMMEIEMQHWVDFYLQFLTEPANKKLFGSITVLFKADSGLSTQAFFIWSLLIQSEQSHEPQQIVIFHDLAISWFR